MKRKKFIDMYCEQSNMSLEEFNKKYVALPCTCGDPSCKGWGVVRYKDPDSVYDRAYLHTPKHALRIGRLYLFF